MFSIHVRHSHSDVVDRIGMNTHPDPAVDYPVEIVAHGDGYDVSKIRAENNMVNLRCDIALLYSRKALNLKSYPRAPKFHLPPNDNPTTVNHCHKSRRGTSLLQRCPHRR